MLEDLFMESQRKYWDEELTEVKPKELNQQQLENFYGSAWDHSLLRSDSVVSYSARGEGCVTRAGLVYFHAQPSSLFPQAECCSLNLQVKPWMR
jgi:predicted HTH transcriptional regulator